MKLTAKTKNVLFILLAILLAICAGLGIRHLVATSEKNRFENATAIDFRVKDGKGNNARLSDFYGKPIVVNFWATWCPPCKAELPAFDDAYDFYKGRIEFMMVNVTSGSDTESVVKSFIAENGYGFPVYFDTEGSAAKAYEVTSIPLTLFIDRNGNVVETYTGTMSASTLKSYLHKIL